MRYFIIAGEASGDIHAAGLIEALRKADKDAEIMFFGGDLMAHAAGAPPVVHYREMAYMGFSEVLRHLPDVRRNLAKARDVLRTFRPDALILVDYPSFNLRVAKFARRLSVKTFYYISPKVWAWKEYRVKQMRRDIDTVYSILPFETAFFHRHGMDVDYVGNPSVAEVDKRLATLPAEGRDAYLGSLGIDPSKPLLALVPGSRHGEIRNNLPMMDEVARRHPECRAVIAGAPSIPRSFYNAYSQLPVMEDATFALMRYARAALVTSGTATLECALAGTPQVVCYRANGSALAYKIMRRLIKVNHVSLPNLINNATVIPEMLLHHCTPDEVDSHLRPLLSDTTAREAQLTGYNEMRRRLGTDDPATTAARSIITNIVK